MASNTVAITEYLDIELDTERWLCRRCGHDIGPARSPYKEGLLVYERDPREIHDTIIDDKNTRLTTRRIPSGVALSNFIAQGAES